MGADGERRSELRSDDDGGGDNGRRGGDDDVRPGLDIEITLDEEDSEELMSIEDEAVMELRRKIYSTIMSSVDFEETSHELLKIKLEPGQEIELCTMLVKCCSEERCYLRYYGLLGQRLCMINKVHQENFEKSFLQKYSKIHRLGTKKLRNVNVAKFFAHLLGTFVLPWDALSYIRLTEEDTTSGSRTFIKILFQELSEHLGVRLLTEILSDPKMQDSFESIYPKDNLKNTRFASNFFTSIGLSGITENLLKFESKSEPGDESDGSGSLGPVTR